MRAVIFQLFQAEKEKYPYLCRIRSLTLKIPLSMETPENKNDVFEPMPEEAAAQANFFCLIID